MISSCNELTTLTAVPEACFGEYFYDNIALFIEKAKKNDKAREKVEKMKSRLSARGVVTQQTSVNSDQVKVTVTVKVTVKVLESLDFSTESGFLMQMVRIWSGFLKKLVRI